MAQHQIWQFLSLASEMAVVMAVLVGWSVQHIGLSIISAIICWNVKYIYTN